jgi:hypothetical protein
VTTLEHPALDRAERARANVVIRVQKGAEAVDGLIRVGVSTILAGLGVGIVWAAVVNYPLRITGDLPTFLALINEMGEKQAAPQSPFLDSGSLSTPHATPYMQTLALLWRFLGGASTNPVALEKLLTLVGLGVFGFVLYAVFLYARMLAGSRVAWITLSVLLGLFGPANVLWASDLTFHGAFYSSFYPQNLALALALMTLLVLERSTASSLLVACTLVAATLLVHPFTGLLLFALATIQSCRHALRGEMEYARTPVAVAGGFALATLWPAYSIDQALAGSGLRGLYAVSLCAALPCLVRLWGVHTGLGAVTRFASRILRWVEEPATALVLALVGAAGVVALAAWEWRLVGHPRVASSHVTVYWVDDRWRWPLMFAAGTIGLAGLVRLARRGRIVPALWFTGSFAIGVAGAAGLPVPVWYRFLLLCQVPLAIGVATAVAAAGARFATSIVAVTFSFTLAVKVLTLVALPASFSYFGSPLQQTWSLGRHIPRGPGLIASDPDTSYFLPAVSGHRVLTFPKGHAGSPQELALSQDGYELLRRFWAGGPSWWQAGQEMWQRGVRYVVVEKHTTLEPKNIADFGWKTAIIHMPAQRAELGRYFYENNRVGDVIYDSDEYVVYRLDPGKLLPGSRQAG